MDNQSKQKIINVLSNLVGKSPDVNLDSQIFHSICLICFVILGVSIPINYWLGIPQLIMLSLLVICVLTFTYYLSRFQNQIIIAKTIFQLVFMVTVIIHYFYNYGINGPFYGFFCLSFLITLAIMPKQQYPLWLSLNAIILLTCLCIDYNRPSFILHSYTSEGKKFLDHGLSYFIVMTSLLFIINNVRKAYNKRYLLLTKKAQDLEQSNQTKNRLISILAHDLREPLNSIQSYLELISEFGIREDEKISLERDLLKRTRETSSMLADMLTWSKNQMAEAEPDLVQIKVKETLLPNLKLLSNMAKDKGITLEIFLDEDICVVADRDMLQLVIRNLVMNAIKFTFTGGLISLTSEVNNGTCIITVKDNGMGIPEEKQEHLFSNKMQSNYGTSKEKGMGLGLVLCKEYMDLQDGAIGFRSKKDVGSEFFISLPQCEKITEDVETATEWSFGDFKLV